MRVVARKPERLFLIQPVQYFVTLKIEFVKSWPNGDASKRKYAYTLR